MTGGSQKIGLHSVCHKLDTVAYIRFASVYRDFRDVEEFVAELNLQEPRISEEDPSLLVFPFAANPGTETPRN